MIPVRGVSINKILKYRIVRLTTIVMKHVTIKSNTEQITRGSGVLPPLQSHAPQTASPVVCQSYAASYLRRFFASATLKTMTVMTKWTTAASYVMVVGRGERGA